MPKLQRSRSAVRYQVLEITRRESMSVTVVFDGPPSAGAPATENLGKVTVLYAGSKSADDVIVSLLPTGSAAKQFRSSPTTEASPTGFVSVAPPSGVLPSGRKGPSRRRLEGPATSPSSPATMFRIGRTSSQKVSAATSSLDDPPVETRWEGCAGTRHCSRRTMSDARHPSRVSGPNLV